MTETLLTILKILGGGIGGSALTMLYNKFQNRLQKMDCHYLDDDVLSKIPIQNEDNTIHQNVHLKKFKIINTTNSDIKEFQILFQFDTTSHILDCYSQSKEGYNRQRIRKSSNNNEAEALVRNFNRNDSIVYVFRVANVSENNYYVTECKCVGFKIKCKDKRKKLNKSKSKRSDQILVVRS